MGSGAKNASKLGDVACNALLHFLLFFCLPLISLSVKSTRCMRVYSQKDTEGSDDDCTPFQRSRLTKVVVIQSLGSMSNFEVSP